MPNALKLLYQHLVEIWKHFGKMQKVNILVGLGLSVAIILGLLLWSAKPEYRLLYSGLSLEEAATIKDKLADDKVKMRLKDQGHSVYVRKKDLYRSRLLLAKEGLPKGDTATAGLEIFDEPKFGLTDFAQRINYQRALQGELQRTIQSMAGVEKVRVMLVIPKEGLLATEEEKKSTASILLHMEDNARMSPNQVNAIVQLVSTSVKNLEPSHVTITDQDGKLLTKAMSGDPDAPFEQANEQLATKERIERQLTRKAQELLDRALGPNNSVVKIDAAMNFDRVERRSERYDKAGRVAKSETIESESSQEPGGARGGLTGIRANIPVSNPEAATMDQGMAKMKKENIKSDYLVPSETQHTVERGAKLTKLSVSVCVAMGSEPRSAADLAKIKELVRNAVGLTDTAVRQDSIEVVEMQFAREMTETTQWWSQFPFGFNRVGRWGIGAIVLLVAFLVMRNVMSNLNIQQEDTGVEVQQLMGDEDDKLHKEIPVVNEEVTPLSPLDEQLAAISALTEHNSRAVAAWITSVVNG